MEQTAPVFISYSSKDIDKARQVCTWLEGQGIRCWMAPRDVAPGSLYSAAIADAVAGCRALVLLASGATNASRHVLGELDLAARAGKPIFPFRLQPVQFTDEYLYYLSTTHWIEAHQNMDTALCMLRDSLQEPAHGQAVPQGDAGDGLADEPEQPVPAPRRRWLPWALGVAALVLLAVMGMGLAAWLQARPHQGTKTYPDGSVYEGWLENDRRQGQGRLTYPADDVNGRAWYEGGWTEDVFDGQGTMAWADGTEYTGQWIAGDLRGQGVMIWADGMRYEGGWLEGMRHGEGTLSYPVDDPYGRGYYRGGWARDEQEGTGTMLWQNGDTYTGQWVAGSKQGEGTYVWGDGKSYTGQWQNDQPGGEGTYTWPDGASFTGGFVDAVNHGPGKYTFADGSTLEGEWYHGSVNGEYLYTDADGVQWIRTYENDEQVDQRPLAQQAG